MRDLIGRTLDHYRIVEKIGEGGMSYRHQLAGHFADGLMCQLGD